MSSNPPILRAMQARNPHEGHRAATPLELLYDLVFVVAIAQAAAALHHAIANGHALHGVLGFAAVFATIWWAWMGFTWFASAFDNDDALYRIKVFIQMCGVTVLAAGVPAAFEEFDYRLVTYGYTLMRVGLVAQWFRAAKSAPEVQKTALRYAWGTIALQVGWLGLLLLPASAWPLGFCILFPLELCVPAFAERAGATSWHPHHIVERYGLLTIIVIGESVLAATLAIQAAMDTGSMTPALICTVAGAPVVFYAMWWLYFASPHTHRLQSMRGAFIWGYAHYFVYAAAAAAGAGLAVAVDQATGSAEISTRTATLAIALPVAVYLAALWYVSCKAEPNSRKISTAYSITIVLILAVPFVVPSALAIGVVLAGLTAAVVRLIAQTNVAAH